MKRSSKSLTAKQVNTVLARLMGVDPSEMTLYVRQRKDILGEWHLYELTCPHRGVKYRPVVVYSMATLDELLPYIGKVLVDRVDPTTAMVFAGMMETR